MGASLEMCPEQDLFFLVIIVKLAGAVLPACG
jgi:hypothetical protein